MTILFDRNRLESPTPELFDPQALERGGLLTGRAAGRGAAWFFRQGDREWVLRHFRRGGWVGRFVTDLYPGFVAEHSRAFREWHLLAELARRDLPAPVPVAACFRPSGLLHRCDLITVRLPGAIPLAEHLMMEDLDASLWHRVGATIRRFHSHGVYHADLNARNILLDEDGAVFLIDFDRGRLRAPGDWQEANLARLRRSLRKFLDNAPGFRFDDNAWTVLMDGYAV